MFRFVVPLSRGAWMGTALALAGCGQHGPKPTDGDIEAYLAASQPAYVRVTKVSGRFEGISSLGSSKLPEGSWRVHVTFTLEPREDLLAPTAASRAHRADFDRAVAGMEEFRIGRIEAVDRLGRQLGLVAAGASSPESAVVVAVSARRGQALEDKVDLLAEPEGKGWRFFQLNAQSLDDATIGAPMATLKAGAPKTVFVAAGSQEEREFAAREKRFLDIIAHAPKP